MVLNREQRQVFTTGALGSIPRRKIIGMQVVRNRSWFNPKEQLIMFYGLLEGHQRFIIFHIPYMLAKEGIIIMGDTKGILKLRTCSQ